MSIEDLLSQAMQVDLENLADVIEASADLAKSLGACKVLEEFLIPWMKSKGIPKEQQEEMVEEVRRFIEGSAGDTLNFKSVVTHEHVRPRLQLNC